MKKVFKFLLKIMLSLVVLAAIVGIFITLAATFTKENLYKKMPITQKIESIESMDTYIDIDSVSPNFTNAMLCIEDHRFYKHSGFDIISFTRAFLVNLKSGEFSQGGSTITQQLAKRMYLTADKTIFRKVTEVLIAWDLEKFLEKDKILELYINSIFYGNSSTGIYNASLNYFGKTPNSLSLEEGAYLAGLPQAPSVYSKDSDLAKRRQEDVIAAVSKYKDKLK